MKSLRAFVVLALLTLVGCGGYHTVAPTKVDREVERGDAVRVTRHDDSWVEFRVVEIEADALYGPGLRVDRREIRRLEKWTQGGRFLRGVGEFLELTVAVCAVTAAGAAALVAV